jgi:hypothetical protein
MVGGQKTQNNVSTRLTQGVGQKASAALVGAAFDLQFLA